MQRCEVGHGRTRSNPLWRKRRGLLAHLPDGARLHVVVSSTLPCHLVPRQCQPKIPPDDWPVIRAEYASKSLRQLAAEWNVSPMTIRKIVAT